MTSRRPGSRIARLLALTTCVALVAGGCAHKPAAKPPAVKPPAASVEAPAGAKAAGAKVPRPRANIITLEEIRRRQWNNAYEMVSMLRSNWLASRGATTIMGPETQVQVHLDDMRLGTVAVLRETSVENIVFVQFFDGIEASSRWGPGYGKGAIQLSTRGR